MRYRISRAARQDLIDIYLRGEAEFGDTQAASYIADLYATFAVLAANPRIARLRPEYDPPLRIHTHRPHVVIYQQTSDGVLIIRVRHGREDWQATPV